MNPQQPHDNATPDAPKRAYEPPRVVDSGRFETLAQGCTKSTSQQCLQYAGDTIRY